MTEFSEDAAAYTVEQVAAYLNRSGADGLETTIQTPHQGDAADGEHVTFGDVALFRDPPEVGREDPPEDAIARVDVDGDADVTESVWMALWRQGIPFTGHGGEDRTVFYLQALDEPLEYPHTEAGTGTD